MHIKTQATIVLVSCLLTACGPSKEVSFKSGGMTHTFAEGQGSIPSNFSLPLYPNATTTGSVSAQDEKNREGSEFLILSSNDSLDKVSHYYQDNLKSNGWTVENTQNLPNLVNISAEKGEQDANVMLSNDGKITTISLSVTREGDETGSDSNEVYTPNTMTPPTD